MKDSLLFCPRGERTSHTHDTMNALLLVVALAALHAAADLDLDRGFGKAIAWRSFPAGLAEASATFDD